MLQYNALKDISCFTTNLYVYAKFVVKYFPTYELVPLILIRTFLIHILFHILSLLFLLECIVFIFFVMRCNVLYSTWSA